MKDALSALALSLVLTASAHSQAQLSFSGGMNTPLIVTLEKPLQINIEESKASDTGFYVVFADVMEPQGFSSSTPAANGDIVFSLNGSPLAAVNRYNVLDIAGGSNYDWVPYNSNTGWPVVFSPGDTLTLSAGTITTAYPINFSMTPADGVYDVYLVTDGGQPIAATITAVPEPSTYALIAGGVMLAGVMIRRRQQRSKAA